MTATWFHCALCTDAGLRYLEPRCTVHCVWVCTVYRHMVPLCTDAGFRYLEPRFTVHRAGVAASDAPDTAADIERLPTAVRPSLINLALH